MAKKKVKVTARPKTEEPKQTESTPSKSKSVFVKKEKQLSTTTKIVLITIALLVSLFFLLPVLFSPEFSTSSTDDTSGSGIVEKKTVVTTEATEASKYGQDYVIFEDSVIAASVQSVEKFPGSEDGVLVTFSVYNKSNMNLDILCQDIYVNDVKLEGVGFGANSGTIEPGKTGLLNLPFSYSRAYVESYDDLSTMQLAFYVMDHDSIDRNYTTRPVMFDLHV